MAIIKGRMVKQNLSVINKFYKSINSLKTDLISQIQRIVLEIFIINERFNVLAFKKNEFNISFS